MQTARATTHHDRDLADGNTLQQRGLLDDLLAVLANRRSRLLDICESEQNRRENRQTNETDSQKRN
jgi:hypothetical protein